MTPTKNSYRGMHMATKSKGKRSQKATGDTQQESPQPEQQPQAASGTTPVEAPSARQPSTSDAQSATASDEMIKKGVYLSALIYVEGYQKPPDDFNTTTITALKKVLSDCLASPPDGLTLKLK